MGLFNDIETPIEDIEVGMQQIKAGGYEFQLTEIDFKEFDSNHASMPNQAAVIFKLTILDGDHESEIGKDYDVFCRVPNEAEQGEKAAMFASMLKQNMLQFGVPESRLGKWDPENPDDVDAIIGVVGKGNLVVNKKNSAYLNLYNFKLTEESGASDTELTPTDNKLDMDKWK